MVNTVATRSHMHSNVCKKGIEHWLKKARRQGQTAPAQENHAVKHHIVCHGGVHLSIRFHVRESHHNTHLGATIGCIHICVCYYMSKLYRCYYMSI